ncbi:MAG: hypothetical protein QHI48_09585 [Bacteroidota bacterium]|nr:hypothetical protein [Bacteroidota bacterium]
MYSLIGLMAVIEEKAVHRRLAGVVPERFAGGVLVGLGLLFFLPVVGVIADSLAHGTPIAETELATLTSDFLITPAWVIGGVLLWRREELGYARGLGLLFQAGMPSSL